MENILKGKKVLVTGAGTGIGKSIAIESAIVDGGTTSWMPFGDGFRKPMNATFGKGYVPGI